MKIGTGEANNAQYFNGQASVHGKGGYAGKAQRGSSNLKNGS